MEEAFRVVVKHRALAYLLISQTDFLKISIDFVVLSQNEHCTALSESNNDNILPYFHIMAGIDEKLHRRIIVSRM